MPLKRRKSALMHPDAPGHCVVRFHVPVGKFLFVYSGQPVRVVVVFVRVKLAQEPDNMIVEFLVTGFPSERHNDLLIDKRGVGNDPGFFVLSLIERDR